MKDVGNNATSMASKLRLSSIVAVAATATMYAGFAALGAEGVALVSALLPLTGLLALLPSLGIAAAGGIAALLISTSGLGAALKQSSAGASNMADAVTAAERRITQAQQQSTAAQVALNQAREDAAQRLRDVELALNRARLDEQGAILAVADAQKALRAARSSGDRDQIAHAALGYKEAAQSLLEVRANLADVTEEDQKRTSQGVEGSDEVQSALQRQADAVQNLADAQAALAKAQTGGGGVDKAAEAYAKLSMAGKQLVDSLKAVAPQWRSVQQAVQQSTFAGVGADVQMLSAAYLPVLKDRLSEIGIGWNNAFRGTAQLAASSAFVADMNTTLGNTATLWQRIGTSFAPFLDGFRQFAVVGSTFLPGIGSWVDRIANAFDAWAINARESGKAQEWIANAQVVLGQVWQILVNLGTAIVGVFRAGSGGPDWLPGLVAGTQALSDWVNSPAGQGKLADVFSTLRQVGADLWAVLTNIGPAILDAFSSSGTATDTLNVFGGAMKALSDNMGTILKYLPEIAAAFILYRAAMAGAVVIEALRLPIIAAQTVASFSLAAAMRANTAAMLGEEAAASKGVIALIAQKVATVAQSVATGIATAAQWLWNIAMDANPIGLIILAIVAIVGAIILLWTHSAGFRDFFIGLWNHIWDFIKMIGAWFAGPFVDFFVDAWNWIIQKATDAALWIHDKIQGIIDFVTSLPGKIKDAAKGMWDGIVEAFKGAINWLISLWNKIDFGINIKVPDWVPGIGGKGFSIPDLLPDLPYLDTGGKILETGVAVVHKGETVVPAGVNSGPTEVRLSLDSRGARTDDLILNMIRKLIREGKLTAVSA
ncbi:MAG: hypothetical protein V4515_14955 [Chloroflexota bacterium]